MNCLTRQNRDGGNPITRIHSHQGDRNDKDARCGGGRDDVRCCSVVAHERPDFVDGAGGTPAAAVSGPRPLYHAQIIV